jgi:hypothetical protein
MTSPTNPINQAYELPNLPPNTVVPTDEELFVPYFSRLYEDIANIVNSKDDNYFPIAITSTPTNIPVLPNFGAFIVSVSGTNSTLPTINASLCKSDATAAGSVAVLGSQVGTGAWAGFALTITSTATNFQIKHNNTGVPGNFNIKIVGTQG